MHLQLLLHPDMPSGAVDRIDVELSRSRDRVLALRFACLGPLKRLRLPRQATRPGRKDELWKATCFELFVGPADGQEYWEYNLSPSHDWACYRFDAYRSGMTSPRGIATPVIEHWYHLPRPADVVRGVDEDYAGRPRDFAEPFFDLSASIDLSPIGVLTMDRPWRVGLSAVIEERKGDKSYWALAHGPGKPDFHHADCFALELPAAKRP